MQITNRVRTSQERVWQFPSVDLLGGDGLAKLLHDERLADGIGVADMGRQPGVGVVQLLLPQILAVCVVKAVVHCAASEIRISAPGTQNSSAQNEVTMNLIGLASV